MTDIPFILGSGSPQRLVLLRTLGLDPRVIAPQTNETLIPGLDSESQVLQLAQKKMDWIEASTDLTEPLPWILTADTLVFLDHEVLGKPQNEKEARDFLDRLSGKTHRVATGVCVRHPNKKTTEFAVVTEVIFWELKETDKNWYLSTGEWKGAAGGYRIQGAGGAFISRINGSYSNVIGLPLAEIYDILNAP